MSSNIHIIGPKDSPTELAGEFAEKVRKHDREGKQPAFVILETYLSNDGECRNINRWYCGADSMAYIGMATLLMDKTVGFALGYDEANSTGGRR